MSGGDSWVQYTRLIMRSSFISAGHTFSPPTPSSLSFLYIIHQRSIEELLLWWSGILRVNVFFLYSIKKTNWSANLNSLNRLACISLYLSLSLSLLPDICPFDYNGYLFSLSTLALLSSPQFVLYCDTLSTSKRRNHWIFPRNYLKKWSSWSASPICYVYDIYKFAWCTTKSVAQNFILNKIQHCRQSIKWLVVSAKLVHWSANNISLTISLLDNDYSLNILLRLNYELTLIFFFCVGNLC